MHSSNVDSVGVIHLVWLPVGIGVFERFINSYKKFKAGYPHQLLIVFNGVKANEETKLYHQIMKDNGISYESLYINNGQDLDCYFEAARHLETDYVLMLNSYSVILAEDWLIKYVKGFGGSDAVGVVAATASNQSYYSSVFQKGSLMLKDGYGFMHSFKKYKLFVKAFLYWRFFFKPFPNPHVRTNSFMISRELFLTLKHGPFTSKFNAYMFESGRKSLTNQLLKSGYKVLVVDKNGKTYEPKEWKSSKTFWISNQENLLISDNQTEIYNKADHDTKLKLSELAWGK